MLKYKVGERIRILGAVDIEGAGGIEVEDYVQYIGNIYTIDSIKEGSPYPYVLIGMLPRWCDEELEKVCSTNILKGEL